MIGIDDAHASAMRTVASFIAHNLPCRLHYPTARPLICTKIAPTERDWSHFKPFVSSTRSDRDVHPERPDRAGRDLRLSASARRWRGSKCRVWYWGKWRRDRDSRHNLLSLRSH